MTTVLLDTNVLVSGIAGFESQASPPGRILRAWRAGAFHLVISEPLLIELIRTLDNPYFRARLTVQQIERALALLRRRASVVAITAEVAGVATHPEDDLVLATAVSGPADYLVTGDRKLQELGHYQGVTILSPRAFVELLTT